MEDFANRFLTVLKLSRRQPDLDYLHALCQSHLNEIPYENVSKLLRKANGQSAMPNADEYLEGIETYRFGGTCYATNYFFGQLLRDLGFDATLVAGRSNEGLRDHLCMRVKIDNVNYALDLGFMLPRPGPFSLEQPGTIEMPFGTQLFRFIPKGDGFNFTFQVSRNGVLGREFASVTESYSIEDFAEPLIASFEPDRLFMRTLCISRRLDSSTKTIWGKEFGIVSAEKVQSRSITGEDDLKTILHSEMQLPNYPIKEALDMIAKNCGSPLF